MKRSIKDWLIVLVLLLDEVVAFGVVLLILWFFKVRIPLEAAIAIALLLGAVIFITHKVIIPSFHKEQVTGSEGMIGQEGMVVESLEPFGVVRAEGELWKAKSVNDDIAVGEEVEIVRLNRLTLEVKRRGQ